MFADFISITLMDALLFTAANLENMPTTTADVVVAGATDSTLLPPPLYLLYFYSVRSSATQCVFWWVLCAKTTQNTISSRIVRLRTRLVRDTDERVQSNTHTQTCTGTHTYAIYSIPFCALACAPSQCARMRVCVQNLKINCATRACKRVMRVRAPANTALAHDVSFLE